MCKIYPQKRQAKIMNKQLLEWSSVYNYLFKYSGLWSN